MIRAPVAYQTNDPVKQDKLNKAVVLGLVEYSVLPDGGVRYQITDAGILVWAKELRLA